MKHCLGSFGERHGRVQKVRNSATALLAIALLCIVSLALATGGSIVVDSTNRINPLTAYRRFEPSSAVGANWVASWAEFPQSYTSAWDGANLRWLAPFEHRTPDPDLPTGDLYLNWDATRSRFVLVMLDLPLFPNPNSVWYRYSLDSQGTMWSTPVKAMAAGPSADWDFPSVAVATNGLIVIGASKVNIAPFQEYSTVVSSNGGTSWSPNPSPVVYSYGGVNRLVASGNVFHAFIDSPSMGDPTMGDTKLERYESTDGINWTGPFLIAQYLKPRFTSPDTYSDNCPNGNRPCPCSGDRCGRIGYASDPDAVGSTGLGWVVAFQYKVQDKNAIAVCRETQETQLNCLNRPECDSFTHSTDLFLHGITTSTSGDYWLTYHTFAGAPNRYLPLLQGVVYRTPTATCLGAVINDCIAPKFWDFISLSGYRCDGFPCFSAGDYMRPASNIFRAALVPFIHQSLRQTDLSQSFVREPQEIPNRPQFLPQIESFPLGADLRSRGILTAAELEQLQNISTLPDISTISMLSRR